MTFPMDATKQLPITTTVRDFLVSAWVGNSSTPMSGDSHAWTIGVGDREYPGPRVDAVKHTNVHDIREMIRAWAKEHPDLFA
jgi:hypothetical protein